MLWLPVGWTAGYLVLLVFVAAPLRRSGAYTLPDFAQLRLESIHVRRLSSLLVVAIGLLYLIPQFQGAGLTLRTLTGAPLWVGQVAVAVVVCLNVLPGGMRSVTLIQAFHYWLKLVALLTPIFFIAGAWASDRMPSGVGAVDVADWVEPLQRRPRPLPHLLARARDLLRHDGPAARRRPLLHQP